MLSCKQWHNIKAVRESEASNEWEESRLGAADHMESLSHSPQLVRTSLGTQGCLRVSCSLGGFGFLAFAFLVFLLKSIHMSSEEVRVRHLKFDNFFGADHCANFLLAVSRSDETFVVCRFKRLRVALSGHRFGSPIILL